MLHDGLKLKAEINLTPDWSVLGDTAITLYAGTHRIGDAWVEDEYVEQILARLNGETEKGESNAE